MCWWAMLALGVAGGRATSRYISRFDTFFRIPYLPKMEAAREQGGAWAWGSRSVTFISQTLNYNAKRATPRPPFVTNQPSRAGTTATASG